MGTVYGPYKWFHVKRMIDTYLNNSTRVEAGVIVKFQVKIYSGLNRTVMIEALSSGQILDIF